MSMSFSPMLGTPPAPGARRDAVHVAIIPAVVADKEGVKPGTEVGLYREDDDWYATARSTGEKIGVVDPFCRWPVAKGERVWVCLYPGSVVGLRHHYYHKTLDAGNPECRKAVAWNYLQNVADRMGVSLGDLLGDLDEYLHRDPETRVVVSDVALEVWNSLDIDEFWDAVGVVLDSPDAQAVKQNPQRRYPFRCAC